MSTATTQQVGDTEAACRTADRATPPSAPLTLLRSVRAEALRLRRWPALWVVAVVWLLLQLAFGYLFPYLAYRTGSGGGPGTVGVPPEQLLADVLPAAVPATLVQGTPLFGGALVMVLGALAVGSGYGWGTWKTVLTRAPGRSAAFGGTLLALLAVVVLLVAASAVVDLGVSMGLATAEGASRELPAAGETAQALGVATLVLAMWASAGALLGVLARGPALAVGLGLVWSLVVENLLRGVSALLDGVQLVTDHLPGTAAGSLVGSVGAGAAGPAPGAPGVLDVLPAGTATAWLVGYLVVFSAVSVLLVRRRDLP